MKMNVYAVYDSKACFFGQPFFHQSDATAIRDFSDAVNDTSNPANMWHKHPEDFSLLKIGEFDNTTGELLAEAPPTSLVTASALRSLKDPTSGMELFVKNGVKEGSPV